MISVRIVFSKLIILIDKIDELSIDRIFDRRLSGSCFCEFLSDNGDSMIEIHILLFFSYQGKQNENK